MKYQKQKCFSQTCVLNLYNTRSYQFYSQLYVLALIVSHHQAFKNVDTGNTM